MPSLTISEGRTVATAHVSRDAGVALVEAALAAARELRIEVSVAVVDGSGALRAFSRTDAASAMTADVAMGKAWTAATSGYPTHVWNQIVSDPRFSPLRNLPRMLAVSGGLPIMDPHLVGGIGVSGGVNDQDLEVATKALRTVGFVTV